ncbi:MAG: MAPEG family protein [Betaproteobacteria bacterium]|nr:MAPEG family protein [Betaproteobacteria bacterium]
MNPATKPELYWLVLTSMMTAIIFLPYILNRMKEHGVWPAIYNPQPDVRPKAQWAERLMRAHSNAVENLVVFAPLVLALQITGMNTATTASASMAYFFARLAHILLYTFAVPVLRTVVFLVGFGCQMTLGLTLLNLI